MRLPSCLDRPAEVPAPEDPAKRTVGRTATPGSKNRTLRLQPAAVGVEDGSEVVARHHNRRPTTSSRERAPGVVRRQLGGHATRPSPRTMNGLGGRRCLCSATRSGRHRPGCRTADSFCRDREPQERWHGDAGSGSARCASHRHPGWLWRRGERLSSPSALTSMCSSPAKG